MVLFSLIKIFKEKTLYMTAGPRPGTACVSPFFVICPNKHVTHSDGRVAVLHRVPARTVNTHEVPSNHAVCSQPLQLPERRVTLGRYLGDGLAVFI